MRALRAMVMEVFELYLTPLFFRGLGRDILTLYWKILKGIHQPDLDCVPGGSCHTDLQPHPCQCLSGPHCRHTGSCPVHWGYLQRTGDRWELESPASAVSTKSHTNGQGCSRLRAKWETLGPAGVRERLTVPINVCRAGVSFPVVVRVSLVWVVVVGAVVTAVSHVVSVIVVLGWVVMERTVVLQREEAEHFTTWSMKPASNHM